MTLKEQWIELKKLKPKMEEVQEQFFSLKNKIAEKIKEEVEKEFGDGEYFILMNDFELNNFFVYKLTETQTRNRSEPNFDYKKIKTIKFEELE